MQEKARAMKMQVLIKLDYLLYCLILLLLMNGCSPSVKQQKKNGMQAYHAKQYVTAMKKLLPLAQKGEDAKVLYYVSLMYNSGNGVKKNDQTAFKFALKSAKIKYAYAQFAVAQMFLFGIGTKHNESEAVKWFAKANENNVKNADVFLAACYAAGRGIKKDLPKAITILKQAAVTNNPLALSRLGAIYYLGQGVDVDYDLAFHYSKKAAEQGIEDSQYLLGRMYMRGQGVKKNIKKANHYMYLAAKNGRHEAQIYIGVNLLMGGYIKKAKIWFDKAKEKGLPEEWIAAAYRFVEMRKDDPAKAKEQYDAAVNKIKEKNKVKSINDVKTLKIVGENWFKDPSLDIWVDLSKPALSQPELKKNNETGGVCEDATAP